MMRLYFFALLSLSILFVSYIPAQKLNFSVGMNMGGSRLFHNTRFETTTLRNLYETIELTHSEGYEWEEFEKDFELRESFNMLRFGFFVRATHRNIPLIFIGEAMSSSSTYEKMAYSATLGFGQEFYVLDDAIYCSLMGGYKLIWDKGFGANTLVNSIGHRDARQLVATYFDPAKPLGTDKGNLFVVRGGVGKTVDRERQWMIGGEAYGELDLTPRIKRESRMTNVGFNLFLRYALSKSRRQPSFNNTDIFYR